MAKVTVCGGGNAAHVLIPLASAAGWEVDVYAPFADEAQRLNEGSAANGGLRACFGDDQSFVGKPRCVSGDAAHVIPGSRLILLALPAFAHGSILEAIAPHLDTGATIGALPARSGLRYQVEALLGVNGSPYRIFGLQTLPWACRINHYGQEVSILGTKAQVDIAVAPPSEAEEVLDDLRQLLRIELQTVASFLTLSLANTGQLIHPGVMYGLCQGRENERFSEDGIPLFYQAVDPSTEEVLQALSDEVQALAAVLEDSVPGFQAREVASLYDWLLRAYPDEITDASSLQRAFNSNRAYAGLRLPVRTVGDGEYMVDFRARYLSEDVPCGLVVVRGIAELAGVETPTIDTVISWAEERLGRRYIVDGKLAGRDLRESRAPQAYGLFSLAALQEQ